MDSSRKFVQQQVPPTNPLACNDLQVLQVPYSNYKQNRPKASKLQPLQPLPTTLCIVAGQVRVVVVVIVVINAHYSSLLLSK